MKKYFKLFEECFIVNGIENYAVYNVLTSNIYNLDLSEGEFCALTENNIDVEEASEKSGLSKQDTNMFIKKMVNAGLGMEHDFPVSSDKFNLLPAWIDKIFFKQAQTINKATLSLDFKCSEKCDFCGNPDYCNRYKCLSCNGINNEPATDGTVFKILDLLAARDCKELYLKNGDLFSDWQRALKIIDYALSVGIEKIKINVVHPIEDAQIINDMKSRNISLIYQCYLKDSNQIDTSFEKIRFLSDLNVTYFLLVKFEQKELAMAMAKKMLSTYPACSILVDFIVSSDKDCVPEEYFQIERTLGKVNFVNFSIRQSRNECFFKSIYFDRNGNVYPCAGLTNEKIGEINSVKDTFRFKNLSKFYEMALCNKEKCTECELRYACNNCEALNYTFTNTYSENILCAKSK